MERGRSRPNLEPVTEVPRARGIAPVGFGISDAPALSWVLFTRSIVVSENAIERTGILGVPGCGRRLRRFGLALPRVGEGEPSSTRSLSR